MILPERLELVVERVLLWYHEFRDGLPGVFLGIPHFACVFHRLIFEIFAELELEEVFGVVGFVEILQPFAEDVGIVFLGLDGLFVEFLLRFGRRYEAVFGDVVAESVGGL